MKTTAYFRTVVALKRPGIKEAWIQRTLAAPVAHQIQDDGRHRFWSLVPEAEGRVLRVVTLEDRETIHNAFFDRGFSRQGGSPPSR
jgi:hypothetical protein